MLPAVDTLHPTKSGAVCTALLVSLNGLERPIELQRSEG